MCSMRRRISYRSAKRQRRRRARRRLRGNMLCMADLRIGTRLKISAPGVGVCIGRVESLTSLTELPDILGMKLQVQAILAEWGVTRVGAISYHATAFAEMLFYALEIDGEWYDMRRQKLTLEIVGQHECLN